MMIVLVLGSVYSVVGQLDGLRLKLGQAQGSDRALALAKEALLAYALTYRDDPDHAGEAFGHLPCPDVPGKSGLFAPGDGTAASTCGNADEVAVGLLPYRTLGLPDLRDASGNCLWYAVSGSFKNAPKASTPVNWDTQGQLSAVDARGVMLAAPDDAHGGAAAIVFAPGLALDNQHRQPLNQPCGADPALLAAYLESGPPAFVQGSVADANDKVVNNDRLTWITPREIFARVVARADFRNPVGSIPQGMINQFIEAQRKALDGRLWASMSALTAMSSGIPASPAMPANHADYNQFAGKFVGDVPDLKPLTLGGRSVDNDFDHWQEQFRYLVCDDLRPIAGCLSFGAQRCRGALLFAGQSPSGGPRASTAKPHAPPPSRTSWLANFFEWGVGLDLLDGPAMSFTGASRYDDAARSADAGICLSPGAYATFAKDIGSHTRAISSAVHPEAAIDTTAATVTLGNPAATAPGSGCVWLPAQLPFRSSLRAYFKMRLADAGEGYVFAIIDGPANQLAMSGGGPCGTTTGSQLGYSGGSLARPKFGLEFDTRSQDTGNCAGNNRYDPGADHTAFVYWGAAAASTDDNCHNAGTAGSGTQPLNPRTLGNGIKTVQASDPHLPYGGAFPLDTDIHVRLEADKQFDGTLVAAANWSAAAATVTLTTATAHGLRSGQRITLSEMSPPSYNGSFSLTAADSTHLSFSLGADPGPYVDGGRVGSPADATVQTAAWNADVVTITTSAAHGFVAGQPVSLSGTTPSAYDGTYEVTIVDATRFSFTHIGNPGAYVAGGTLTPAVSLTLRAYVASKLLVFGSAYASTCTATDLRDLSVNLDELRTQNATITQDKVYMDVDALTGRALSSVYAGFTNAQNTGAAGRQSVTISGFLVKTQ